MTPYLRGNRETKWCLRTLGLTPSAPSFVIQPMSERTLLVYENSQIHVRIYRQQTIPVNYAVSTLPVISTLKTPK